MMKIELSDFVRQTLIQIAKGIHEANEEIKNQHHSSIDIYCLRNNKGDNSKIPGIQFDVGVTAAKDQTDKAGFFVSLVNIVGGANTEKTTSGEIAHRIRFEVGLGGTWQ